MTVFIVDEIFNHEQQSVDFTEIFLHVTDRQFPEWEKYINGEPWHPGFTMTLEYSDTFEVVDVIKAPEFQGAELVEEWNPVELKLVDWAVPTQTLYFTPTGMFIWQLPEGGKIFTLTKWFHVEPCIWKETILFERFMFDGMQIVRPVVVFKEPSQLWIDAVVPNTEVLAGDVASFTLTYGNNGGRESYAWIENKFPPGGRFLSSVPPPDYQSPYGGYAAWMLGELDKGDSGSIDVTVAISSTLEPSTTIVITDWIFNHFEIPVDWVTITLHVTEPVEQDEEYDIYLKDHLTDDGSVPSGGDWWTSPDIWVRTDGDCTQTAHQNPSPGTNNTVCVRVRNRMTTTVEDITVDVYWAVSSLGLSWPGSWTYVDTLFIASLGPGAEEVQSVVWNTPNITGHFCLLARADAPKDPIGSGFDTVSPTDVVQNNNNIAQQNVNVVEYPEIGECGIYTTTVFTDEVYFDAVNTKSVSTTIKIEFDSDDFPSAGQLIVHPGAFWGEWTSLTNFDQDGQTLIPSDFPATMAGLPIGPHASVRMSMTIIAEIDAQFSIGVDEYVGDTLVGGIVYVRQLPVCLYLPELFNDFTPAVLLGESASVFWLDGIWIQ
jgi:hypothetical protein